MDRILGGVPNTPSPTPPTPLGLRRRRRERAPCGLCGRIRKLTKTHVPPRTAGNTGPVTRCVPYSRGGTLTRARRDVGGLHFYGLCQECNGLQSKYDPAYSELAQAVERQLRPGGPIVIPRGVHPLPDVTVRPGAAARSILIGMMALDPNLREIHPTIAQGLLAQVPEVRLPDDLALRVACTRSPLAHLAGSIGGVLLFHPVRPHGTALGVMSFASVYFRPLAWHLATRRYSWLDLQAWPDVSRWLTIHPSEDVRLRSLSKGFPEVLHPREDPHAEAAGWVELFSDEITVLVEGELPPSPPNTRALG